MEQHEYKWSSMMFYLHWAMASVTLYRSEAAQQPSIWILQVYVTSFKLHLSLFSVKITELHQLKEVEAGNSSLKLNSHSLTAVSATLLSYYNGLPHTKKNSIVLES